MPMNRVAIIHSVVLYINKCLLLTIMLIDKENVNGSLQDLLTIPLSNESYRRCEERIK